MLISLRLLAVTVMAVRQAKVIIETRKGRVPLGFTVPPGVNQVDVAIKARENGFRPYQVRFEPIEGVLLVKVLNWRYAA
jgi:hypothetical protein